MLWLIFEKSALEDNKFLGRGKKNIGPSFLSFSGSALGNFWPELSLETKKIT